MKRGFFLSLVALLIAVGQPAELHAKRKPNIVFLLADDLGWKDVGCYGGPVNTPTLDRLAELGTRFTSFYSGAAVCSPSRATVLTGRQHLRAGVYSWIHDYAQKSHLLEREVTIAEVLKKNGYATVHLGKWHLGLPTQARKKPTPADHGFDYWFATGNNAGPSHRNPANFIRNGERVGKLEGYSCRLIVKEAIRWLEKHGRSDTPFFLNVWFHEPHDPIAAPYEIVRKYGSLDDPAAVYSATIENTDRAIARLIKEITRVADPENTLVVYSSDNGSYRADRVGHLRGKKGANYDGGIRVPGIFWWPGTIPAGQVETTPAGLVDLLPTICGLAGIEKPRGVHLDGSDLSPLLRGGSETFRRHQPLFWLLPNGGPAAAIRDGKYTLLAHRGYAFPRDTEKMNAILEELLEKLRADGRPELTLAQLRKEVLQKTLENREHERIRGKYVLLSMFQESWIPAIKKGSYQRFELFDLEKDPSQKRNIAKIEPETFERLRTNLLELRASVMRDAPDWIND